VCKKTCSNCNGPLRADSKTGICTRNAECSAAARRTSHRQKINKKSYDRKFPDRADRRKTRQRFCKCCGGEIHYWNKSGFCGRTDRCRSERAKVHNRKRYQEQKDHILSLQRGYRRKHREVWNERARASYRLSGRVRKSEKGRYCYCYHCGEGLGWRNNSELRYQHTFCAECSTKFKSRYWNTKKCEVCSHPLHPKNRIGVCTRTQACRDETQRRRYWRNRNERLKKVQEYRDRYPEHTKALNRASHQRNKVKRNAYSRAYHARTRKHHDH
jgi:hypothetical protein